MGIFTRREYLNEVKRKLKDGTEEDLDTGAVSKPSDKEEDKGNDYNVEEGDANEEDNEANPADEENGDNPVDNTDDDNSNNDTDNDSNSIDEVDDDTDSGNDDTSDLQDTDYGDNDYTSNDDIDAEDVDSDGDTTEDEKDSANDTEEEKKDEIAEIEADIFKDLSPEQLNIKVTELKNKFLEIHTSTSNTLIRLQSISKTEDNRKVVDFCVAKLTELKELVYYYITATFDTKSYVENNINLQQYISTLATIGKLLKGIIPKKEQKE